MAHKVRMPRVDANVDEGTVGTWFVEEGDRVESGEQLVEIITDKATFGVESDTEGYLRKIIAPEKSVLPVGYVLAIIAENRDESLPDVESENQKLMKEYREQMLFGGGDDSVQEEEVAESGHSTECSQQFETEKRVRATPSARQLARKNSVNLEELATEVDGVIQNEDVQAYLEE